VSSANIGGDKVPDTPYFLPKTLLAALPAAYAWQLYGIWLALAVFLGLVAAMWLIGWIALALEWPPSAWRWARRGLVILAFIVLGLSAAQRCNEAGCTPLF
jgi:hypothetical protein